MEEVISALRLVVQKGTGIPSERELARQLNVNRHQVRRALEVLRLANEIEPAAARRAVAGLARGTVLARDTNPLEVIEVRMALEPALARLAAVRASPLDIARIQKTAVAAEGDPGANDLAFHKAIAAGSRNQLAASLYLLLREIGRDARLKLGTGSKTAAPGCPKRLAQRNAEHLRIAEAIAARDAEAAERAMRAHLTQVHRLILSRLNPETEVA